MDPGRNLQLRVRVGFAVTVYVFITALFPLEPGVGKSMTMDKFVVTKKKAEPPTAQPPAKRQRLSLHKVSTDIQFDRQDIS